MRKIRRGMVIDVNLEPIKGSETGKIRPCVVVTNNVYNQTVHIIQVVPLTAWSAKKGKIKTNITIEPSSTNGLSKKSVADGLQTRPIDKRYRLMNVRGQLTTVFPTESGFVLVVGALAPIFGIQAAFFKEE